MPAETTKRVRRDGHARELEQKRSRGEVSCAECRRLKIKCDKQIPCQSCQRRGCASLCPNGSLSTGQGTRFVLAATEHLHRRIARLTSRVRQLEDALAEVQGKHYSDPHPLLSDELVTQDKDDEPMLEDPLPSTQSDVIDAFGTLSISDHGISRFFGPTGGSESLLLAQINANTSPHEYLSTDSPTPLPELALFSQSFPFTPMGPPADVHDLIVSHLPPWNRAQALVDIYFDQVYWLFRGVTKAQLRDDTLPVIYRKQQPTPGEDYSSPHDLALVFMVFAVGALVQVEPSNAEGEHFHQLARAALGLQPVLEKPSIVTIQTLHLMSIYNSMNGSDLKNDTSMELTWSLITLASHLSKTIGLHRDSARWHLSPKMVQRRRILFWDLFVADVWTSLNNGRPPSFSLAYIDCIFPQYETSDQDEKGTAFEIWQFRFAAECVAEVTSRTLTAEAPSYSTIMELDRKIREFPLPEGLSNPPKNDMVATSMRCVLDHIRETVLMYMHRSFFAQAIIDQPLNPLKSAYAPSFTASYRAASTILKSINEQFALFPNACSRFWTMWTFAFTAAVIFGTVVTRGPRSPVAQSAMAELEQALVLFTKASKYSIRALKALPILSRLAEKARYALANAKAVSSAGDDWAIPTVMDIGGVSPNQSQSASVGTGVKEEEHDELSIFAGHTRFVSKKKSINMVDAMMEGRKEKSRSASAEASVPLPTVVPSQSLPPSHAPTSTQAQPIVYSWQPQQSLQYEYAYVPSERSLPQQQQQQHYDTPSPESSSSSSNQGYSQWSTDPIVLHPPSVPQVPQVPTSSSYQRQDVDNGGVAIELHPPYYPQQPPPPRHVQHTHQHTPSPPHLTQPYTAPPQPPAATAAAAYSLNSYPRYSQHQPHHSHSHSHSQSHISAAPPTNVHSHPHPTHAAGGTAAELADLGLASRDSRLDERWSSFMADSGLLGGY
ncbi:hypothetical protein D9756_011476 [Leucocoprinus leucothites]|uniref:Zn(2)-C6 fungal-type domain-containing protein n=1 Tax=Leucocoprinus leucothites TaxID=201217 RepID=A0A8H5CPJ7_9AGAR|nr:hypothetical protein D9756_011476 [Leucoagaricus leucothites]